MKTETNGNKQLFLNKYNPYLNLHMNENSRNKNSPDNDIKLIIKSYYPPNNKVLKYHIRSKNISKLKSELKNQVKNNNNNNRKIYKPFNLTSKNSSLQNLHFIKQFNAKNVHNNILLNENNSMKKFVINNKFDNKNNIILKNAVLIIENWWQKILLKRNITSKQNNYKNQRKNNNKNNSMELYICKSNNYFNTDNILNAQTEDQKNVNILWNITRDLHETNDTSNKITKTNSLLGTNFISSGYNKYSKYKTLDNNLNSEQTINNNKINLNKSYLNIEKFSNKRNLYLDRLIIKRQNKTKLNKLLNSNKHINYSSNKKNNKNKLIKNHSKKKENKNSSFYRKNKLLGLQCKIFDYNYKINSSSSQEKIKKSYYKKNNKNTKLQKTTNYIKSRTINNNSKKNTTKNRENTSPIKYKIFLKKNKNLIKENITISKSMTFESFNNPHKGNKINSEKVLFDRYFLFPQKNYSPSSNNKSLKLLINSNQVLLNSNSKKEFNSNKKNKKISNKKKTNANIKKQKNIHKKDKIIKKSLYLEKQNKLKSIIPYNIKKIISKTNGTIKIEYSKTKKIIKKNNTNPLIYNKKNIEEKKINETLKNNLNIISDKINKETLTLSVKNLRKYKKNKINYLSKRGLLNDKIVSITHIKKQESIDGDTPRMSTIKNDNYKTLYLRQEFILEQLNNDSDALRIQDHKLLRENSSNRSTIFLMDSERNSTDVILRNVNLKKYSEEKSKIVKICKKTVKSKNKNISKKIQYRFNSGNLSEFCRTIINDDDFNY